MTAVSQSVAELPVLDVFSLGFCADPVGTIRPVRETSWAARSDRGIELLTYEACRDLLRDERFPVGFDEMLEACDLREGPVYDFYVNNIANLEGERHVRLRRIVAPLFTPRRIAWLRRVAREIVEQLLHEAGDGKVEFVGEVARRLPSTLFCDIIGSSRADSELLADCSENVVKVLAMDPSVRTAVDEKFELLSAYVREQIAHRRAHPADDLLTDLIARERDERIDEQELIGIVITLLMASTDSTSSNLSLSVLNLIEHPDEWHRVREDPSLVPSAVQECARFNAGQWADPRIAREAVEFRGIKLREGSFLFAVVPAAHHDPAAFPEPDRFDVARKLAFPTLNWGVGRHHCIGRALAVTELEEAIEAIGLRWAAASLDGEAKYEGRPAVNRVLRLPLGVETSGGRGRLLGRTR